jgi:hypothetical protein
MQRGGRNRTDDGAEHPGRKVCTRYIDDWIASG